MPKEARSFWIQKKKARGKPARFILFVRVEGRSYPYVKRTLSASTMREAGIEALGMCRDVLREQELLASQPPEQDLPVNAPSTCSGLFDAYMRLYADGRKGILQESSIRQVVERMRRYTKPFFGGMRLDEAGTGDIIAFRDALECTGLSPKTKGMVLQECAAAFKYAEEKKWIETTPFDSMIRFRKPEQKNPRTAGSLDDYRRMLCRPWKNPVAHAMLLLAYLTGMRASEIRAMRKTDFIQARGRAYVKVMVRRSFGAHGALKKPKNGTERWTVIPYWAYAYISPVFAVSRTDLAFSYDSVSPYSLSKLLDTFKKEMAATLGISIADLGRMGYVVHSIRHFYESLACTVLPPLVLRFVMGHKSGDVQMRYFEMLPEHIPLVLQAADLFFTEEQAGWFRDSQIMESGGCASIGKKRRHGSGHRKSEGNR